MVNNATNVIHGRCNNCHNIFYVTRNNFYTSLSDIYPGMNNGVYDETKCNVIKENIWILFLLPNQNTLLYFINEVKRAVAWYLIIRLSNHEISLKIVVNKKRGKQLRRFTEAEFLIGTVANIFGSTSLIHNRVWEPHLFLLKQFKKMDLGSVSLDWVINHRLGCLNESFCDS